MGPEPRLSVVIPVRNAAGDLRACLEALFGAPHQGIEVIVVDDASSDATGEVASSFPCRLLTHGERRGPAAARNLAVRRARGEIILFIDADILVRDETAARFLERFDREPAAAAVVGMLDERSPHRDLPTRYFNLRKHYDYLVLEGPPKTLYSAVTAVRRRVLDEAGGFDERYRGASVEDGELGRRLHRLGHRIVLDKGIRVTHLKRHTIGSLLASDAARASRFARLVLRERLAGGIARDRRFGSFRGGSLLSVAAAPVVAAGAAFLGTGMPPVWGWALLAAGLAAFTAANGRFFSFAGRSFGPLQRVLLPPLVLLDSLAILAGITVGAGGYLLGRRW